MELYELSFYFCRSFFVLPSALGDRFANFTPAVLARASTIQCLGMDG